MKINELEQGKVYTIPLVVKSTATRETRAKKPYLTLVFFDGQEEINGNYWDWGGSNIPENNAILNVLAEMTSWNGQPQLTVKSMTTNTELTQMDFMPKSGLDVSEAYNEAYCLASDIQDDFLRDLTLAIFENLMHLWLNAPAARTVHHAYQAGTLIHSLSVGKMSKAIAQVTAGANVDLATCSGLLHDVGKLFGYTIKGVLCDLTDEGMMYDHLFIGAEFVGNFADGLGLVRTPVEEAKLSILRHIILSHHGSQENGAVVPPACIEAHIVFHADSIDAAAEQVRVASSKASGRWTEKVWALSNRPHLSTGWVQDVFAREE